MYKIKNNRFVFEKYQIILTEMIRNLRTLSRKWFTYLKENSEMEKSLSKVFHYSTRTYGPNKIIKSLPNEDVFQFKLSIELPKKTKEIT